jgi:hypothetical protein
VLNQQNDRQSVNSATHPTLKKTKKGKKQFMSERNQMNPGHDLQNNQND